MSEEQKEKFSTTNDISSENPVASDFLTTFMNKFVDFSKLYLKNSGLYVFSYNEDSNEYGLWTAIAPILNEMTQTHYAIDFPIMKLYGIKPPKSLGRIDFWCHYKEYDFAIEMKYSSIAYKSSTVPATYINKYNESVKLLKDVPKNYVKSNISKGLIRIALNAHVISFKDNKKPTTQDYSDKLVKIQNLYIGLDPKTNWSFLWKLSKKDIGPFEIEDTYFYQPGVLFTAYVF